MSDEKLTHLDLVKELEDVVRVPQGPDWVAAFQEAVKIWWHLHLAERHRTDIENIRGDLATIDAMDPDGRTNSERTFLWMTRSVLVAEENRHQKEINAMVGDLGGRGKFGVLASLFPHVGDFVHIEKGEEEKP